MVESDGIAPVPQECFEAAVLAVVGAVLRTERRIDLAADTTLAEGPHHLKSADLRADLILCAAECLRLITTLPGGRSRVAREFPEFAAICGIVAAPVHDPSVTRIDQALRRFTAGLAGVSPEIGRDMYQEDGRSLIEVITRAMEEARQRGQEQSGQIDHAVAAVMVAEQGLSRDAARRLVETLCS